ncbi:acyl dehydratase, partial [Chloroflexota bacterium]
GTFKKLSTSNRGMMLPRQDLLCKGKVTNKYIDGNEHYVECEIWAENPRGERPVPGVALVTLPSRS